MNGAAPGIVIVKLRPTVVAGGARLPRHPYETEKMPPSACAPEKMRQHSTVLCKLFFGFENRPYNDVGLAG